MSIMYLRFDCFVFVESLRDSVARFLFLLPIPAYAGMMPNGIGTGYRVLRIFTYKPTSQTNKNIFTNPLTNTGISQ